jgi:ClpP class serine protease
MNLRSALALRGNFAISEDAVHEYLPLLQSYYRNQIEFKAEDLPDDDVINPDDGDFDEDQDTIAPDTESSKIIVMNIHGPIMHYGGACSYGAVDYATRLRAYADDNTIMAGMIDFDTPGGQVEGTETWAAAVQYFASKKPIIGFCEDGKIASAGIWGAVYCTEIYAGNTLCRFGSVGVMACLMDARKAMEMEGIKEVIMYAPQSTDKNKTGQDAIDGKTAAYIADLKFICDRFINVVSTQLADRLTSEEWNSGKMFFAEDAQRIGLINGIKTRDEVIARLQELSIKNNQSNMFGNKFAALSALSGVAAASITAEQLTAVNEQIAAQKIDGITAVLDSELETAQQAVAKVAGFETQINALNTKVTGYEASIKDKDAQIAKLQAKLDGKPAEDPTGHQAADDKITPTAGAVIEASIETSVDRELAAMHAMHKLSI